MGDSKLEYLRQVLASGGMSLRVLSTRTFMFSPALHTALCFRLRWAIVYLTTASAINIFSGHKKLTPHFRSLSGFCCKQWFLLFKSKWIFQKTCFLFKSTNPFADNRECLRITMTACVCAGEHRCAFVCVLEPFSPGFCGNSINKTAVELGSLLGVLTLGSIVYLHSHLRVCIYSCTHTHTQFCFPTGTNLFSHQLSALWL